MSDIIADEMRDTGLSRKIDDLGRIVLPSEIRKSFGIREGDLLDISVENERVILSLQHSSCVFCNSTTDLKEFQTKMICATCIQDLTGSSPQPTGPDWDPFAAG
ncbi:MAG: AbrB/MazE/SpoVT family DNA-binding domain-containing protein [Actinomycetota bacterium]|nr:AbrB/MazE/SpoVT family DNA-binding domain-containing protein [Actinomycetota bacterium]